MLGSRNPITKHNLNTHATRAGHQTVRGVNYAEGPNVFRRADVADDGVDPDRFFGKSTQETVVQVVGLIKGGVTQHIGHFRQDKELPLKAL